MRTILRDNYTPEMGAYHEVLIIDEIRHKKYLFDCDGVFTDITNPLVISERGDSEDFAASQKWVTDIDDKVDGLAEDLGDEIQARTDADDAIWAEIEEIEMSSDVVDIVGTYAELQQYDTAHLKDNDIIKVLSDETHQDKIAYYRWSTATDTFSYVGSEGPYYTESEVDTLLSGKQDTLIAGTNIQIAADGKTISATDTTYTAGTGLNLTGTEFSVDTTAIQEKLTAGSNVQINDNVISATDTTYTAGTGLALNGTEFSVDTTVIAEKTDIPTVNNATLTITQNGTSAGTFTANSATDATIALTDTTYSDFTGATSLADGTAGLVPAPLAGDETKFLSGNGQWTTVSQYSLPIASANDLGGIKVGTNLSIDSTTGVLSATDTTYSAGTGLDLTGTTFSVDTTAIQEKLTAGSNISISGTTISATDTTYSAMTGATSGTAGAAGLVPAPAAGDQDKVLSGAGTWVAQSSGATYTAGAHISIDQNNEISATYSDFVGSDGINNGVEGLVPAPNFDDVNKYLKGDGTWADIAIPTIEYYTTEELNTLWEAA